MSVGDRIYTDWLVQIDRIVADIRDLEAEDSPHAAEDAYSLALFARQVEHAGLFFAFIADSPR